MGPTVAEDQGHGEHTAVEPVDDRPQEWLNAYMRLSAGNRRGRRVSGTRIRTYPDPNCGHKWAWVGAAPPNWQPGPECEAWECLRCDWCDGEVAKRCDSTS